MFASGGSARAPRTFAGALGERTGLVYRPAPDEPVPVVARGPASSPEAGGVLRVVSWNIQYGGTRAQRFFYDGGDAVHVPVATVRAGLEGIGGELDRIGADLALLQEVDRDSDRTGRVDELAALIDRARYPVSASATYHRSRFVPHPPRCPMGRVEMCVAILGRVRMADARRLALPLMNETRLRRAFNLKRCLLTTQVPVRGGRPLHVAVTHLSAFTRGDGTLGRQVAVLRAWMEERERRGEPFVLGGDLNLLPPGDDPARLGADAREFQEHPGPVETLVPRFRSVIPPDRLLLPESRTYLQWGAARPDRVLDYVFVSRDIEVLEARVVASDAPWSDHLPIAATIRLPGGR